MTHSIAQKLAMAIGIGAFILVFTIVSNLPSIEHPKENHKRLDTTNIRTQTTQSFCMDRKVENENQPHVIDSDYVLERDVLFDSTPHWYQTNVEGMKPYWINTHDPTRQDVHVSGSVAAGEPWDTYVVAVFKGVLEQCGKECTIVDAGAHIGYYSLMSAAYGAKVIAFEPLTRNIARFMSSVKRNQFDNLITMYHNALADSSERVKVTVDDSQNCRLVFETPDERSLYGIDHTSTLMLDNVLGNSNIDLIKVDLGGQDFMALNGMRELIKDRVARYIMISFHKQKSGFCKYGPALEFIRECGYRVSDISPAPPQESIELRVDDMDKFPPSLLFTRL